ncbi:MAG: hypothetical protein A2589_01325 [Candidatus Vogelbacteria bacterium RIFOXYD1_FULL_46_19]|uniref:Uncharacterized protein n=1 Tax=Candidatus Vogelbacteria bacterium RIFOXYD1_FULL_46_19 TaxID=1802439 RepID=A0A1G2QFZ2_9BACT|nr:MAG: hypothetical protein A2589_01325 [Candidatus Vogelbacteria bacterium RIFOXYD1_FULL_46_19]
MLRLFVDNTKSLVDPVFPVRWCLCPGDWEELRKRNAQNIHVVISVVYGDREVDRHMFPIDRAMEYIRLRRAGTHTLNAFVVWCEDDWGHPREDRSKSGKQRLRQAFASKEANGVPTYNLYDGNDELSLLNIPQIDCRLKYLLDVASVNVEVGAEFFAPEPPEWEKKWVNLLFSRKPVDQCAYRRRRIFAYTLQFVLVPLIFAVKCPIRLTALLFTILTARRYWKFAPVFRIWTYRFEDVWDPPTTMYWHPRNNLVLRDKEGNKRNSLFLFLHPCLWLAVAGVAASVWAYWGFVSAIGAWLGMAVSWLVVEAWLYLLVLVVVGIIAAYKLAKYLYDPDYHHRQLQRAEKLKEEREAARKRREDEYFTVSLQELVCPGDRQLPVIVSELPVSRRTFRLRFQELKKKVCRPFAL